jgi:hypothetical protein
MSSFINTPVRADLVGVQPMYYPIVERGRFSSIKAMCNRHGWPLEEVNQYVMRACLERSAMVVMDRMFLGDPEEKMVAVLLLQTNGAVVLCCGLFNEVSQEKERVQKILQQFEADRAFKGKLLGIGEFRPNPARGAS